MVQFAKFAVFEPWDEALEGIERHSQDLGFKLFASLQLSAMTTEARQQGLGHRYIVRQYSDGPGLAGPLRKEFGNGRKSARFPDE